MFLISLTVMGRQILCPDTILMRDPDRFSADTVNFNANSEHVRFWWKIISEIPSQHKTLTYCQCPFCEFHNDSQEHIFMYTKILEVRYQDTMAICLLNAGPFREWFSFPVRIRIQTKVISPGKTIHTVLIASVLALWWINSCCISTYLSLKGK